MIVSRAFLIAALGFASLGLNAQTQEDSVTVDINANRPDGKSWYVSFSGSYGLPFMTSTLNSPLAEVGLYDYYKRGADFSITKRYGSRGTGPSFNVAIGHMFNKNIGLEGFLSAARHPTQLDARQDINGYYAIQETGTTAMYFAAHLVSHWDNGKKFGITGKVGPLLPFYGNVISDAVIKDKSGQLLQTLTGGSLPELPQGIVDITLVGSAKTTLLPTVGVSGSIGFDYKITPKFTLYGEARALLYTVKLKETIFQEMSMSTKIGGIEIPELGVLKTSFKSVDEAPEFLKHYVYYDEITEESNTARYGGKPDLNKPMDELSDKFNASTLYLSIGFRMNIDRWSKGRGEKKAEAKAAEAKKL